MKRLEISAATMEKFQAAAGREYRLGCAELGLNASAEQIDALLAKVCRNYRARCDAALLAAHATSLPSDAAELLSRAREMLECA
jgi:hypothetical protein